MLIYQLSKQKCRIFSPSFIQLILFNVPASTIIWEEFGSGAVIKL
jgi:hypothetical protein